MTSNADTPAMARDDSDSTASTLASRKNFLLEQLRVVYAYIFPNPKSDEREGIERRSELCRMLNAYDQVPEGPQYDQDREELFRQINAKLSEYHQAGSGVTGQLALDSGQFAAFKKAFLGPEFSALQNVQSGKPPETPVGGVLTVGPYELQVLYNALFRHANSQAAHDVLHEMKKCAGKRDYEGIKAQLQKAYNDSQLVDVGARQYSGVKLHISNEIAEQIAVMFASPGFKPLEPYAGIQVCFVEAVDGSGPIKFFCY